MRGTRFLGRLLFAAVQLGALAAFPRAPDFPLDPGLLFFAWFVLLRLGIMGLGLKPAEALLLAVESLPFLWLAGALPGRLLGTELAAFLLLSLVGSLALLCLEEWAKPRGSAVPGLLAVLVTAALAARLLSLLFPAGAPGRMAFAGGAGLLAALALFRMARRARARRSA